HAYIYHHLGAGSFAPITVLAPASGTISGIVNVTASAPDGKTWVDVNSRYIYYFDHVVLAPGLSVGSHVTAGQVFGTSPGIAFDFAVIDLTSTQSFITPARYGRDTINSRSPFPYFVEPLRSAFYAKVQRNSSDLDGKINYDVAGTLSGNWFADTLPVSPYSSGGDSIAGGQQLAFARDVRFPDRQRVSIGGFFLTGAWGVPPDAPDFTAITPASGVVVYRLLYAGEPGGPAGTQQSGLLIVQLTDTTHLKVEVVVDQLSTSASFSSNAKVYVR
ncbi:MAG: hypothetical protein WCQ64_12750, partial [Acidobacteriota bacterium]